MSDSIESRSHVTHLRKKRKSRNEIQLNYNVFEIRAHIYHSAYGKRSAQLAPVHVHALNINQT